jgi:hypothetical protein
MLDDLRGTGLGKLHRNRLAVAGGRKGIDRAGDRGALGWVKKVAVISVRKIWKRAAARASAA